MGDAPRRASIRRGVMLFAPGPSNLTYFISGACSALSFGAMSFEPRVTRDSEGPWVTVGGFLAEAVKETVANHPSLPPLPEDLYSKPERSVSSRISAGHEQFPSVPD